jgi:uncharacterized membrane protein YczE
VTVPESVSVFVSVIISVSISFISASPDITSTFSIVIFGIFSDQTISLIPYNTSENTVLAINKYNPNKDNKTKTIKKYFLVSL